MSASELDDDAKQAKEVAHAAPVNAEVKEEQHPATTDPATEDPPAASTADDGTQDVAAWQWLFSPDDMESTPSVLRCGLTTKQERYNRWKGVQLIFRIGDYIRLGNHVTCTAAMFFHRFYMRKAMPPMEAIERPHDTFTFQEMAPTCIFLACKVEEAHRKLHGIVEATMAVLDRTQTGIERAEAHIYRADVTSRDYRRWKDITLLHEERLLEALCFDMIIEQPHSIAIKACQRIGTQRDLAQLTITILNCLLYGSVSLFSDASTLAACAFKKACSLVDIDDPNVLLADTKYSDRNWNEAFDVDNDEIEEAMPAIEEHLAFHQERLAPAISALQSSKPATPLPAPHSASAVANAADTSMSSVREADYPSSSASHASENVKHTHFADPQTDSIDDSLASRPSAVVADDDRARNVEPRSDDFRPISRHGSRGNLKGPPPPLSSSVVASEPKDEGAFAYAMQSPKRHEDGQSALTNQEEASAPQEPIAKKIKHEQAQQESGPPLHRPDPAKHTAKEDSEEEGAL